MDSAVAASDPYKRHFELLAGYHLWAFEKLFAALASVPDDQYAKDVGLFFKSIHGTLNHLLLADMLWYGRHTGQEISITGLDQQLHADRQSLKQAILEQAARWKPFVASLKPSDLTLGFSYTSTHREPQFRERGPALDHMFNHGTHHRGQISAAITHLGHQCPEMDLLYFSPMTPPPLPAS